MKFDWAKSSVSYRVRTCAGYPMGFQVPRLNHSAKLTYSTCTTLHLTFKPSDSICHQILCSYFLIFHVELFSCFLQKSPLFDGMITLFDHNIIIRYFSFVQNFFALVSVKLYFVNILQFKIDY